MLPREQPLNPDGIAGWIMSVVFILVTTSTIPAAFSPINYISNPASSFGGLVSITAVYAFNLFTIVTTFIINLVKKSIKYLYVVVILAFILQAIVMLNETDYQLIKMTDKGATKYALPAYNTVAVPIARFGQLTYNMGICWWDLQAMYRNVLVKNVVNVFIDCQQQDWQLVVNSTVKFVGDSLSLPILFAQSSGQEPFQIQNVVQSGANALVAFKPGFQCSCQELEFAYDILFDTINNTNLHGLIDRAINGMYYYPLNITAGAVDALFGVGPLAYDCNNSNLTKQIQCSLTRPPYLIPMREAVCEFGGFTAQFLEDEVNLLVKIFIDQNWYNGSPFVFHDIIGAPFCAGSHFLFDTLDLLTHIDLIFTPNVLYLRISPINEIIQQANKFCDAITTFFSNFDDLYMGNIASVLAELLRMVFFIIDELKNFAIALFYEPFDVNSLKNYFINFNVTRWSNSYETMKSAVFNLFTAIDARSEAVIQEAVLILESIGKAFLKCIQLLATDPSQSQINGFVLDTLPPYVNNISLHAHGIFVAGANFFRQFDETNSCNYGIVYPASIVILTNPSGHVICELANIVETVGQAIRSSVMQITNTLFDVYSNVVNGFGISSITPYVDSFYSWFNGELGTIYNNAVGSFGGLLGSFFGNIDCPCTSGGRCSSGTLGLVSTTVRGNVKQVMVSAVNGTVGIVYQGPAFVIKMIKTIVDAGPTYSSSDISTIICQFMTGLYDFAGRLVYIFKTMGDAFDCLLGGDGSTRINILSGTVYYVLFSEDNQSSLRNLICPIVSFILQVINFFYGFISQGIKYLTDLIVTGAKTVVNMLIDLVNKLVAQLNKALVYIQTAINGFMTGVKAIICFLNQMAGIFDCLTSISIDIPVKEFDLVIPGIDLSFKIKFGALGTLNVPLKIPGWDIPFYFPVPDFSKITNAIDCLTNGFDNLGHGCSTGCGSGPIQSSICTGSVNVPGIPTIPHINKRDTTGNDTFYIDVMQNYTLEVCGMYQRIAQNESLQIELRQLYSAQWMSCVFSAQTMFAANMMIFRNMTDDWLVPTTLMSIGDFTMGSMDMASKLYFPVSNEIACYTEEFKMLLAFNQSATMTNSCLPWDELYQEKNLTSEWIYRVGHALEEIRIDWEENWLAQKLNASNGTNIFETFSYWDLFSGIWNGLSGISDLIFNPQPGANVSLYDSVGLALDAYNQTFSNMTAKRFYDEHLQPIIFHETSLSNQLDNRDVMGFNATDKWVNVRNAVMGYWETKKSQMDAFFRPKSQKAIANRNSLSALSNMIYGVYNEYSHKYGLFKNEELHHDYINRTRNRDMLMSVALVNEENLHTIEGLHLEWLQATPLGRDKIKAMMTTQLNQVRTGSVPNAKRDTSPSDICGIPTIGGTTCLNCTLLKSSLDILVSRTTQCVAMTQLNFDLAYNQFFSPFIQIIANPFELLDSQTDGVFSQWMNEVALINFTIISQQYNMGEENMYHLLESKTSHIQGYGLAPIISLIHASDSNYNSSNVMANQRSTTTNGSTTLNTSQNFSAIIYPTKIIANFIDQKILQPAVKSLLSVKFGVTDIINKIQTLFGTGVSTGTSNSIYYWISFCFSTVPSMDCQDLAARGIGVGNLPLTLVFVAIGYLIFIGIVARISYVILAMVVPLTLLSPYLIISINYGVSPLSVPALPFCLADDLYSIVQFANVDCVSWNKWFPGLTPTECPTSDTDYTRDILQCSSDPYYFDNPWRVFYYLVDSLAPSVMDYIKGNDNYLSVSLRNVQGMDIMMTFPYPTGHPTDEYTTCFKLRAYNLYIFFLYVQVLGLLGFTISMISILTISFLGGVVYFIGLICMSMSGVLSASNVYGVPGIYSDPKMYVRTNLARATHINNNNAPEVQTESGVSPASSRYVADGEVRKLISSPSQGGNTTRRHEYTYETDEEKPRSPSLLSSVIERLKRKKE